MNPFRVSLKINKRILIIGGGVNGLVAANYLQRGGYQVTLIEKKQEFGGACTSEIGIFDGKRIRYPTGASVLGMMQDFVFSETGLKNKIKIYSPKHPPIISFEGSDVPAYLFDKPVRLKAELRKKWNERGKVIQFIRDFDQVRTYLIRGYRDARPPSLVDANQVLGRVLSRRWITGSAKCLLDYYFTSEKTKVFFGASVIESGPVSFSSPFSAFSIPLMGSGSLFSGQWGYVQGGIWKVSEELVKINRRLGVKMLSGINYSAEAIDLKLMQVTLANQTVLKFDSLVFACDPLSAAKLVNDPSLIKTIKNKKTMGSSGKLVLIFRKPPVWINRGKKHDFDVAFRLHFYESSLKMVENSSNRIRKNEVDSTLGYLDIYSEGLANLKMNHRTNAYLVSVFFKHLSTKKSGHDLAVFHRQLKKTILNKIKNPADCFHSILLSPKDLKEKFFFPGGNIDHVEIMQGQTFISRTYSSNPKKSFYQFGRHANVFYCGAGAYPCGSVSGTPGYMCAKQIIDQ